MDALQVILGAVIAMLSSVITTVLVIKYQRVDMERKRKWELDDRKYNQAREIYLDRLSQLEEYATDIIRAAKAYESAIITGVREKKPVKPDPEIASKLFGNVFFLGAAPSVGDTELPKLFSDLIAVVEVYDKLIYQISKENFDEESIKNELASVEFVGAYAKVLSKLDQLRANFDFTATSSNEEKNSIKSYITGRFHRSR